ncbi:hypothetical protein MXL54_00630 [Enterobacteriaceae bacterium G50]|nr:hypothetical protein [Enterobacteriaceae bacterium G50]
MLLQGLHFTRSMDDIVILPRISLVWHRALPCHHQVSQLESTTVYEKQRLFVRTKTLPKHILEWGELL